MIYSFDTDIAKEVGVNAATIYHNIQFWCAKNKANNSNYYDGEYWCYNSVSAWEELFPFLSTRQIRTALTKLEEKDFIAVGCYNKSSYDRTKWYRPLCQFHLSKMTNQFVRNDKPIPDSKPDSKPYTMSDAAPSDSTCWLDDANELYLDACERFYESLLRRGKIKKSQNWKTKSWYDGFRLMVEVDGLDWEKEIYPVVKFYLQSIGKEYCPEAYSPSSVRTKWIKIKSYYDRAHKNNNTIESTII